MDYTTIAGTILIGCAFVLMFLPVAECDQCPHCRAERLELHRRDAEQRHKAVHRFYGDLCPICRKDKE